MTSATPMAYGVPPFAPARAPDPAGTHDFSSIDAETLRERARDQAEEFESVFLTMFVQEMFKGIDSESEFSGGHAGGVYQSMMAEQYAGTIARSGGIGLADHVYTEILKAQQIDP